MATSYVLFLNHETDELGVATHSAFKNMSEIAELEYLKESEDVHDLCSLADTVKVFCTSLPPEIAEQFD
jgi:hypothetical protein